MCYTAIRPRAGYKRRLIDTVFILKSDGFALTCYLAIAKRDWEELYESN